ncbi:MAG: hypothetical protein M1135_02880 [Candidatus Omnitrophica bacterium]|nr:hypothetical protein [Candidatus Omnitrophota bacterium]
MTKEKIIMFLTLSFSLQVLSANVSSPDSQILPPIIQQQVQSQPQVSLNPEGPINRTGKKQLNIFTNPGVTTEVDFPSRIEKIISNAQNDVSLETVDNRLFIHCLDPYQGIIFVIAGKISYPLSIIQSDNADVKIKVAGGEKYKNIPTAFITSSSITVYLKKLFLRDCPDIVKVNKKVFHGNGIIITIKKQLTWPEHFRGYIVRIENITRYLVVIPVEQISLPGLVAVSVDNEVLKPGKKTKGYFLLNYTSP